MIDSGPRPLDGIRVLELGQLLAGPFAGTLLGYWGADVVKVEPPSGDPIRTWRGMSDDTSVWWRSLARNKRCIVIDLRNEEGRALVWRLVERADVILENFRPGTMEGWGLGPDDVHARAPRVVYARVSGFGQTGPERDRAGFASVCEAAAGLRHLTGMPGEPSVRANLSLGDTLGGMHAMMGIVLALFHRERTGKGQVVDVALTESVLGVLESVLGEADRLGIVRGPSGPTITGVVPSGAYRCADGESIVIGANTDGLFGKLMRVIERPDLADDPSLATNPGRVTRASEIDVAIAAWTSKRTLDEAKTSLASNGIPASGIRDARAILRDPQFVARGIMDEVPDSPDGERVPALFPKLGSSPGRTEWAGPALGAHTREVLEELGVEASTLAELEA